jgi:hypothetical protein
MNKRGFLTPEQSPALHSQAADYPAAWDGRIPRRVQMVKTVRISHAHAGSLGKPIALEGVPFDVWVGWNGMTIVLFESGEVLCVGLDEFVVLEWHLKGNEVYV